MRKSLFLLLAAFSLHGAVKDSSFEVDLCYRTDQLIWKFQGNNIEVPYLKIGHLYESEWQHMNMFNLGAVGKLETYCRFYAVGKANYGWVYEGQYRPRGLLEGNGEFYEDLFSRFGLTPPGKKLAHGYAWDISAGFGYKFSGEAFQFAPLIGWDFHDVNFHTDTYVAFTRIHNFISSAGRSKACLDAFWTGPWIGFDAAYQWDCCLSFVCDFEYLYSRLHGNGRVNSCDLIKAAHDFDFTFDAVNHFRLRSNFQGIFIGGGVNYNVTDCTYLGFHVDYWHMQKTGHGTVCHKVLRYMQWNSLRYELAVGAIF